MCSKLTHLIVFGYLCIYNDKNKREKQSMIHVKDREFGLFVTTPRTQEGVVVKIVDFGHFGCKIGLLFFTNLTKKSMRL